MRRQQLRQVAGKINPNARGFHALPALFV